MFSARRTGSIQPYSMEPVGPVEDATAPPAVMRSTEVTATHKSGGQQIATGATVTNVSQWRDSYLLRYTKPGGQYPGHQNNAVDDGAENNFWPD